jgi:hypothetical protein
MGIKIDEDYYHKLIDEDIKALNEYLPKYSVEKNHIMNILRWSISALYPIEKLKKRTFWTKWF